MYCIMLVATAASLVECQAYSGDVIIILLRYGEKVAQTTSISINS